MSADPLKSLIAEEFARLRTHAQAVGAKFAELDLYWLLNGRLVDGSNREVIGVVVAPEESRAGS